MSEAKLAMVGRLTREPELRFTPSGKAVCSLSIATSRSYKDPETNKWENKDVTFWNCTAWERFAENIVEFNFKKGDAVIAYGTVTQRSWEDRDGNQRNALDVRLDALGYDLRFGNPLDGAQDGKETGVQQTQEDPWGTRHQPQQAPFAPF